MLKRGFLYLFLFCVLLSGAQTRKRNFIQRELGFFGGGSYYIGDINPRRHFFDSQAACGIFFRYSTNYRYAFRLGFNYGNITANDAKSKEADQLERNLNFRSKLYELNGTAEFNFVEYRIGQERYPFTMYVFAGLSGYYFDPQTDIGSGYQSLRTIRTEGQSSGYAKYQVAVPFGIGIKFNVGDKVGIGLEWGPRKTYTDYLDDVSGAYPETTTIGEKGNGYTDRSLNGSATPGAMRGNPTTKDWYFFYGLSLNIKLPDPHRTCHGSGMRRR